MKIAVMGAGAVGCYFGGYLAQAGAEVVLIARGPHLKALKEEGLRVSSPNQEILSLTVPATDNPAEAGPVDIVMLTVKLWDVEDAADRLGPMLRPGTAVISFQNGVDAEAILLRKLGPEYVMGGVSYIAATITEPGNIRQTGNMAGLAFGELNGERSARGEAFLEACRAAGFRAILSTSIELEIWKKFVFLVGLSGVTCVTRSTLGPILQDPATRDLLLQTMNETAQVGRAAGVGLDEEWGLDRLAFCYSLPPKMKSSMLNDLEQGRRLELEWLSGTVHRLGLEYGIKTPANSMIYTTLKLHVDGRSP